MEKMVSYKKKVYRVLQNNYTGDFNLYKLQSRYSDGAPFSALKTNCIEVHWSETLEKFVTIPN